LLFVSWCLVTVNTHPKTDDDKDKDKCLWNNEAFIRSSFERTCSQQLLVDVKHVVDGTLDGVRQVDNASSTLRLELTDVRQTLVSSMTGVVRRQNGFQKTLTEMQQALRRCDNIDDRVIASVSRTLDELTETQTKSATELQRHFHRAFDNFTAKLSETDGGLDDRMARVAEAQERSTSNIVTRLDAIHEHLQQGTEQTSTERLLTQVKDTVDNISAAMTQLMTSSGSPDSTSTCIDVHDKKQQLVSALTGMFVSLFIYFAIYFADVFLYFFSGRPRSDEFSRTTRQIFNFSVICRAM